jgi:Bacterial Ig-like domain (group 3)
MQNRLIAAAIAVAALAGSAAAVFAGAGPASASPPSKTPVTSPASIPVLDWHELNNGCDPSAPVCNASDPESVSTAQLTAELSYLKALGYQTITPAQYKAWAHGQKVSLPSKPVFLIADNGIENLLAGAEPVLAADHFTMAVAAISGFADGATGRCTEPTYQPGCPLYNQYWDATWAQLKTLPSSVYNFILESGAAGHFVQNYDPNCTAFYACMVPGETATAYEQRVATDLATGQSEIVNKVGWDRFTTGLWVVPYSDAGYQACTGVSCTPQPSDGPAGWLPSWTAANYPVAFVEDSFRNGIQNERFRIDVQGWMTESTFETMLNQDLASGYFTRVHTPEPVPTNSVTDSSTGGAVATGSSVTFTAALAGSAAEGGPTGTVSWQVSGSAGATACTASSTTLDANGQATCTVQATTPGTVVVSAAYGGDENYQPVTSSTDTVTAS